MSNMVADISSVERPYSKDMTTSEVVPYCMIPNLLFKGNSSIDSENFCLNATNSSSSATLKMTNRSSAGSYWQSVPTCKQTQSFVGGALGEREGVAVGLVEGLTVGSFGVGGLDGELDGRVEVGVLLGSRDGAAVGVEVTGGSVGDMEGSDEGDESEGGKVGWVEGAENEGIPLGAVVTGGEVGDE